MKAMGAKTWGRNIPDIPILIAAGGSDSAGNFGKRPAQINSQLIRQGHTKVTLKIFPKDHHEILNELDKEQVYACLLEWIDSSMKNQKAEAIK
jgi:alpha-beta hydrolase superfamily lysophospholipase